MVEVNGANKHGRYERIWLHCLREMSNVNVFGTQEGQTDKTACPPNEHILLHNSIHMLFIWIKTQIPQSFTMTDLHKAAMQRARLRQ